MGFSTKGKEVVEMPEFIKPGINVVSVVKGELVDSKDKSKQVCTLTIMAKSVEEIKTGKVLPRAEGTCNLGIYFTESNTKQMDEIVLGFKKMGEACGVMDKIDAIDAETLQQFIDKAVKALSGKFFAVKIKGKKGDKGLFLDGFTQYTPDGKSVPKEKKRFYLIAIPEKSIDVTSVMIEPKYGAIGSILYEKSTGGIGSLKWDPANIYDLSISTTSTVTPDEDLSGEVRQPDF